MSACPLFVELCAGTAAVSLRLARARARPPVSRMGSKAGWGDTLLGLAGLRPGQGAGHYLWCEPDPGCRLLLEAYRDAALAKAAADIIRGWAGEDPRALWERLRAEGPPRGPEGEVEAREVARWMALWGWHYRQGEYASGGPVLPGDRRQDTTATATGLSRVPTLPATIAPDARGVDPREVARLLYMAPVAACPHSVNARCADPKFGGDDLAVCRALPDVAHKVIIKDGPCVLLPDLRGAVGNLVPDVDRLRGPREVVGPVVVAPPVDVPDNHPWGSRPVECSAHQGANAPMNAPAPAAHDKLAVAVLVNAADQRPVGVDRLDLPQVADHVLGSLDNHAPLFNHVGTSTATISYGGASVQLPPGTVVYMDPSYVGTTGYADNLSRADVVALARRWAAAGALVMVCEAEPIPELVAEGWHARDIAHARRGQSRTFSKQQREVVTMNRAPVHVPAEQVGMFGGGGAR